MTIPRKDVKKSDRWNVEKLYPTYNHWERELKEVVSKKEPPFFTDLSHYMGKLHKSAKTLLGALDHFFYTERSLRKLYTYAKLKSDENIVDEKNKSAFDTISTIYHQFSQETSWLEPEILTIPEKTLNKFLKDPILTEYKFYIERMCRMTSHTLSAEEEKIMAFAEQALDTPYRSFSSLSDADFKFGTVKDKKGKNRELTHATFSLYLRDFDRTLRKNAFTQLLNKYQSYENTICELLRGVLQKHLFEAKARGYTSYLEASLYPKNISKKVYLNLIETVRNNIHVLHDYIKLRKKALNLKELHFYDLYVPIVDSYERHFTYEEAENITIESSKALGPEYHKILKKGLKTDRWVDRYENLNKRSGAYSSGCFDSMPYILMNFKGVLRGVTTLAHEAGHSMHSYYSRAFQPYCYSDYSIFVAEVASTFNEELVMDMLLEKAKTPKEKAFLINERLEDIRATLFRQTMFAEFELFIHEAVEKRIPITPQFLKDEYLRLQKFYFGNDVSIDPEIASEWSRIPHFYYGYYVYQYATGISAAITLADRVTKGGIKEREEYLNFLKAGSSCYPLDALKIAGIDMHTAKPIEVAIQKFATLTKELEKLILPRK